VCPACGAPLHGPGLSFVQRHFLSTLTEVERVHAQSALRLADARRNHWQTTVRLLMVGMLCGTGLLLTIRAPTSLLSTLVGLLGVLVDLTLCQRLIPETTGLLARVFRWIAPCDLAVWKQEAVRVRLAELAKPSEAIARALAVLRERTALPSIDEEAGAGPEKELPKHWDLEPSDPGQAPMRRLP